MSPLRPEELQQLFDREFVDHGSARLQWGQVTVDLDATGYVSAARFCRDDPRLAMDYFDCLAGIDEREDGFSVVVILYSTTTHQRVMLRHLCAGGRDRPTAPSLTALYRGADWHEREAWDMFGIEFDGHPGLAPRILTTENFEGWPLRKDFFLATREAKPWPGIKEPLELDEDGQPVVRTPAGPGGSPGPSALDELMAEQAKLVAGLIDEVPAEAPHTAIPEGAAREAHPDEEAAARAERARRKAAELRAEKAEERRRAEEAGEPPTVEEPPPPGQIAAVATAQDPRVTSPEDRGGEAGEAVETARREPSVYPPGEETATERARRAVEETAAMVEHRQPGQGGPPGVPPDPELPQLQGTTPRGDEARGHLEGGGPGATPPQAGDEPAPGAEAGKPPTTQQPGEAPVEGGIHETVDRKADAQVRSGGERPRSTEGPAVELTGVPEGAPTAVELGGDMEQGPAPERGETPSSPPARDRASRELPEDAVDTLRGEAPETGDPRERALRDPAAPGPDDPA
ncbi:MAG TPA: NADH-quinone oxidoreductase subunit C, partial [Nitriliruptorales bacterium]|nr:NADH-quinone oxidoreductase subunit C [Nitriliruptorales bacterium]